MTTMSFGRMASHPAAMLLPVQGAETAEAEVEAVAGRLAELLLSGSGVVSDSRAELEMEPDLTPRPLGAPRSVPEVWAVDGGQGLVADARCLEVVVTRAAVACFRDGAIALEEEGPLGVHLLGSGVRAPRSVAGVELPPDVAVDLNLLRDAAEWAAVASCVERAVPGSLVVVDGDLVPDWRLPAALVDDLLARATDRSVSLVAVTKHSSLARGGAPLVGQLEIEAAQTLGARFRWWVPVGRTREGSRWPRLRVVVARLDPDARYAFRIDLPTEADPEELLSALAAVSADAAFPGYPYPLSVADRLAACPAWLRAEVGVALDEALERASVPAEVRDRAFADRHRLMERA